MGLGGRRGWLCFCRVQLSFRLYSPGKGLLPGCACPLACSAEAGAVRVRWSEGSWGFLGLALSVVAVLLVAFLSSFLRCRLTSVRCF